MTIQFKPSTIYYIKMVTGEEIVTEVYVSGIDNVDLQYFFVNPMLIHMINTPDDTKLITMNIADQNICEENTYAFNPDHVVFANENLSEMMHSVYDKFIQYLDEGPESIQREIEEVSQLEIDDEYETPPSRTLH